MTAPEYDASEANQMIAAVLVPLIMAVWVHWQWESLVPLVLSSGMALRNLHNRPLFKIHMLGQPDVLSRPFGGGAALPSFSDMMADPEKTMEDMKQNWLNPKRVRRPKKLTGKQKRERKKQLEKAS